MNPEERVRRLAALANLELTAEEVARYAADLPATMAHMVAVLSGAPASDEPWLPPRPGAPDEPRASLPRERVLGLAPESADGYIIADLPRGR